VIHGASVDGSPVGATLLLTRPLFSQLEVVVSPVAAPVACSEPGCPDPAIDRGRCGRHRRSEAERGYGRVHRAQRRDGRPTATCSACGCTDNLQLDHRIPASLGGGDELVNKRWLCRCPEHGCHDRLGVRSDRPR